MIVVIPATVTVDVRIDVDIAIDVDAVHASVPDIASAGVHMRVVQLGAAALTTGASSAAAMWPAFDMTPVPTGRVGG
jgi:hypothetical protein